MLVGREWVGSTYTSHLLPGAGDPAGRMAASLFTLTSAGRFVCMTIEMWIQRFSMGSTVVVF